MTIIKKILLALTILLILAIGGYFFFRDMMLESLVRTVQDKIHNRYACRLQISEATFTGFARVQLDRVALIPTHHDTLFSCQRITTSFSFTRFLKGQPPVDYVVIAEGRIQISEKDSLHNNYSFLFAPDPDKPKTNRSAGSSLGPGRMLSVFWKRFLAIADFNFTIRDFEIVWKAPSYFERLNLETFSLLDTKMQFRATDSLDNQMIVWVAEGTIDPGKEAIEAAVYNLQNKPNALPFLKKITGIACSLKSVEFQMEVARDDIDYELLARITEPAINHWRISPEDVRLDSLSADLKLVTRDSSIFIHYGSAIMVNRVPIELIAGITVSASKALHLQATIPEISSELFFGSLPDGLFNSLKGIQTKGTIAYKLEVDVNTAQPDSVQFNSDLDAYKFGIKRFGEEDLSKMNRSFYYEARENDRVVKVFPVGPENPLYTPLNMISPLLINCVLTAEDGTFFHHSGFNEEAFRKSIATNIREKRFARGGSTISMQLVKNVHLNRNKTISRKVEEALLVWLIENYRLCSKERMLEVYLNVIEWGPGIYGITDAARYYFDKIPAELTLDESIYLSSIIPNPKAFRYSFDKTGNLRPYLQGYFRLVAGRLKSKEIISQTDLDSLKFTVNLAGPARDRVVIVVDSVAVDTSAVVLPQPF
jgi:hypothetical protein